MAVDAQSAAPPGGRAQQGGGPPKRRLRNYLLDPGFQLKYTGYVVIVTVLVAGTLGYLAYQQSHAQTEMLSIGWAMQGETEAFIEQQAAEYDRNLLTAIVGGVLVLTLALAIVGIFITHRVVGPAYKMKLLFQHVADGHLSLKGRLRKGDELQDVFLVYEKMIETLRERQREEIGLLESGIERARAAGASEDAVRELVALKERMQRALD
ncbi:methyl-accepting chemotaxis protein [Sandaracinus amylolyticus]|uniref:HAMP domain protein n=1 Tax=Sandaracinus amylolyticus TaxID=927083 RepID=A0A0F6W4H0_9BACT|nr:methyl-accepting chemotaxis protein [Sandaracinus amylolyticus]AKF07065.1 HAMP domain protein [Sandaracinus amylolyticus]